MSLIKSEGKAYSFMLGEDVVQVGDPLEPSFQPVLSLSRWKGECRLKLRFDDSSITGKKSCRLEGDKVKWESRLIDLHYYPLDPTEQFEHGGVELEFILKQKPSINSISLPIETEGLKFYYQPPLTKEEIEEGCTRPPNIVGSYAVYHASKRDNDYKCGKAFHIPRPDVHDAKGLTDWCSLNISDGLLTITVPQDFLDKAVYPVTVGELTFGKTDIGGTLKVVWVEYTVYATKATLTEAGLVSKLTWYGYCEASGRTIKGAISDDNSNPNNLKGATQTATIGTSPAWHDVVYSSPISLSAALYWLDWMTETGANQYVYYYDTVSGASVYLFDDDFNFNNPFGTPDGTLDREISIYATYTEAGGQPYSSRVQHIPGMRSWGGIRSG